MLQMLIKHYGNGKKVNLAQLLGVSPQNISTWMSRESFNHELIYSKCPNLSPHWLLTGEGDMLICSDKCINSNSQSEIKKQTDCVVLPAIVNNYSTATVDGEPVEVQELPIIPANIVNDPKIDVYDYIDKNDTEMAPIVRQFPEASAFYRIKIRAMEPIIYPGDVLALAPYTNGEEDVIPGDIYVVETSTNGLITRILFPEEDGYRAMSSNREKHPDFLIRRKNIKSISRIVGLLRTTVQAL